MSDGSVLVGVQAALTVFHHAYSPVQPLGPVSPVNPFKPENVNVTEGVIEVTLALTETAGVVDVDDEVAVTLWTLVAAPLYPVGPLGPVGPTIFLELVPELLVTERVVPLTECVQLVPVSPVAPLSPVSPRKAAELVPDLLVTLNV